MELDINADIFQEAVKSIDNNGVDPRVQVREQLVFKWQKIRCVKPLVAIFYFFFSGEGFRT